MSFFLKDKVAIITGGSSGFGIATAHRFAEAGAHVVVASRREKLCHQVAADIEQQGGVALGLRLDVTDEQQVEALIQETVARMGRLDILVNNAGVTKRRPLTELELEEWEWIHGTNLRGPFLCCKYALRQMLAQGEGGAIVNIASYLGMFAHGFAPAYTASKAGLIGLTKSLAVRYGPEQIRVNAICPAFIKTSLNAYLIDDAPDPAAEERAIAAAYPLRRLGQADDVAYAALFLASDAANWITGITLMLDGGLTAQ